jgi:hypothetical protein
MSVVIIGGNERLICRYKDICKEYNCDAKVYTQKKCNLECLIGEPDLIILCTNPVSHEMAKIAKKSAARKDIKLVQTHCASCSTLRTILSSHTVKKLCKTVDNTSTTTGRSGSRSPRLV